MTTMMTEQATNLAIAQAGIWTRIGLLRTPIPYASTTWRPMRELGSVSVWIQEQNNGAIASTYDDSTELILVPRHSSGLAALASADAEAHSIASAWLWGNGPIGGVGTNPFEHAPPYRLINNRRIFSTTGYLAPQWEVYARTGMLQAATNTMAYVCRMIGRLDTSPGGLGIAIDPACTVPPFVGGRKGAANGTQINNAIAGPARQRSLHPRIWNGQMVAILQAANTVIRVFHIGGGPWKMQFHWESDRLLACSGNYYRHDQISGRYELVSYSTLADLGVGDSMWACAGGLSPSNNLYNELLNGVLNVGLGAEVADRNHHITVNAFWL